MSKKTVIALILISILTLGIRVLSYNNVFGGSFTSFLETDAYNRMYYAGQIASMPLFEGIRYTFENSLLFSSLVAGLSLFMPLEIAGAWLPPIFAVGTVLLVYAIGARVFNNTVGVLGALFTSIIPSEFLHRTLLGFADHHAMEVFLFTLTLYLVIVAFQSSTRWRWSIAAGVSLFLYLATWKSGLLLVAILGIAGAVILINGIIKKTAWKPNFIKLCIMAGVFLVLYLPTGGFERLLGFLPIAADNLPVAGITTREMISTVTTPPSQQTISELMPLFFPAGKFNLGVVISNLHLFAIVFIPGMFYLWKWRPSNEKILFLVWTLGILLVTLLQRRNMYYLTINVGLISALALWEIAAYVKGVRYQIACILAIPLVLISAPFINAMGMFPHYQMPEEWHRALVWLEKQEVTGHVTAWSDYGHWIKYVTNDTPNLLPGPGGAEVAQLLLSTDAEDSRRLMEQLDTEYLIVDCAVLNNKMIALQMVAGEQITAPKDILIYRLITRNDPQPYLIPVYESETIKILLNTDWSEK